MTVPWRLALIWIVGGVAASAGIVLREISLLLGAVEERGVPSFGASGFTGLDLTPFGHQTQRAALLLWARTPVTSCWTGRQPEALCWMQLHAGIDFVFFAPACAALLFLLLRRVGVESRSPWILCGAQLVAAWIAIGWTWYLVYAAGEVRPEHYPRDWMLTLAAVLTDVKWLTMSAALLAMVGAFLSEQRQGMASLQRTICWFHDFATGNSRRPSWLLRGVILVVLLFFALVAFPAGGALEQLPDVLRVIIGHLSWRSVASVAALLLLAVAVATAAQRCTAAVPDGRRPRFRTGILVLASWLVGLALLVANLVADRDVRFSTLAVPLVVSVLALAAELGVTAGRGFHVEPREPVLTGPAGMGELWAGGLAGCVVVIGGIGAIRATIRPLVLEPAPQWIAGLGVGALAAVAGGVLTQLVVMWALRREGGRLPGLVGAGAAVVIVGFAVAAAVSPLSVAVLGATTVVALCLAFFALLLGELGRLSARGPRWTATAVLFRGARTPWIGLLVAAMLLAGALNSLGGYHDVRVLDGREASYEYRSPSDAFAAWSRDVASDRACMINGRVPLLLVAAPGGGIRASYWTAAALDRLAAPGDPCGRGRIFLLSGVSGGSVGAAVWLGEPPGHARAAVQGLAEGGALAGTIAALFLRDLPQPLLGFRDMWRDRAAVMADSWTATVPSFRAGAAPRPWSGVGRPGTWTPVTVLNGSSVTDGCRALVTNTAGLPASGSGCDRFPVAGPGGQPPESPGPVPASLDVRSHLVDGHLRSGTPCPVTRGGGDLSVATAALLSARFPLVSPSGAVRRCVGGSVDVTYDVDGGYYENSGILTALQLWSSIENDVRAYNDDPSTPTIEPLLVVLDNHYSSAAKVGPTKRPREFVVPFAALAARSELIGQKALQQRAEYELGRIPDGSSSPVVVLGPANAPTVQAPLGWVLSPVTRRDLDHQLCMRLNQVAGALRDILDITANGGTRCPRAR